MKKLRKAVIGSVAVLATSGALVACGEAPEEDNNESGNQASDFLPCIVSDQGGFDDKSFNQLGYEGVKRAADELGTDFIDVESNSPTDFGPNLESLVSEGCDAIVSVGFALSAATIESAKANPDIDYILIDDPADADFDGTTDADNIKPLLYDTSQAAFLAGYAAADTSKTGVVGTYGGEPFPTVTIFMDGFKQGVEYYNKQKNADVKVVGWDGKTGSFTGSFESDGKDTNTAKQLLDQNVDVILPVGGPIYEGAITAIQDSGDDVALVGTDSDIVEKDPKTADLALTSIQKAMDLSTYQAIMDAAEGKFDNTPYIGTLENDGVSIADFHNWESKVSDTLADELDEIRAGIQDGSIKVKSYLQ
ncbi:BMP family ABC transporter substrate-binding protein [Nocardioides sp. dk4132]|uniref:BMP family lipoprotein n=1 Tax=unclassified Nocardioides TaxID=2615069 RepID=UPI0012968186|nr:MULTISPECIES: BMP family ABC transporter substrate-binding protein [unclassified Nocardioides]MQW75931.1 BMP family ABC transporter substrate-binding protein [Nocardioides sp. dk4132]QGA08792.1 BMP family ABC transporter substrate-binding protein [Nocardioides sp. dk884]